MINNYVDGGDLMLFLGETTLAFATSHKLSVNVETVENTNKDNSGGIWKSSRAKKITWNVSSDNLFLEKGDAELNQSAFGDVFDLMVKRQPVVVKFSTCQKAAFDEKPDITAGGWTPNDVGLYEGSAIITSLEANAPCGDNATYSVQLEGIGALKHTPEPDREA